MTLRQKMSSIFCDSPKLLAIKLRLPNWIGLHRSGLFCWIIATQKIFLAQQRKDGGYSTLGVDGSSGYIQTAFGDICRQNAELQSAMPFGCLIEHH